MDSSSIDRATRRRGSNGAHRPQGTSLLEMMLVVTVILIVASIATPIYTTAVVRAREAVLHDHLYSLRNLLSLSPPRKRGSTQIWIPAPPLPRRTSFAGMTDAQRPRAARGVGNREQRTGNRR